MGTTTSTATTRTGSTRFRTRSRKAPRETAASL
jgi:hypothetical protein